MLQDKHSIIAPQLPMNRTKKLYNNALAKWFYAQRKKYYVEKINLTFIDISDVNVDDDECIS